MLHVLEMPLEFKNRRATKISLSTIFNYISNNKNVSTFSDNLSYFLNLFIFLQYSEQRTSGTTVSLLQCNNCHNIKL